MILNPGSWIQELFPLELRFACEIRQCFVSQTVVLIDRESNISEPKFTLGSNSIFGREEGRCFVERDITQSFRSRGSIDAVASCFAN
jgi:hypothetical protein